MGWLITFAILFLLAILPLGASVKYNADGPLVRIIAGPVRLTVFPLKKKEKKPKKEKPKVEKKPEPQPAADDKKTVDTKEEKKEKGGSLLDFLPLVQVALDFLGDFRRKLRLNRLELKLIMAGDDPCDLAVNYGRAWAAVGNLFPLLERAFVIKKRDVEVECDFTASEMLIIARLDITITLGRLIALAVRYGIRALREYLKIMKLRKGGAVK
jgi:hypothetical protein